MKGNFQIIILVIFIAAAVLGVLVFAGAIKIGKDANVVSESITLWGTAKKASISKAIEDFNWINEKTVTIKYEEKDPVNFDRDLLEALASGKGPDIFFVTNDLLFHYKDRIYPIPYESFPMANFKGTFAGAGEVFMTTKGIAAFPIAIDPLMMYYNRSLLDANSIVYPPANWDDFSNLVPILTKKDETNFIFQSGTALGQFSNILNAKEILSTLFLQAGSPILREKNDLFIPSLTQNANGSLDLGSILSFYVAFADPLKSIYSWNKSLPNSQNMFTAGNLAFYFGHASELPILLSKNPNLNFSVAPVPQIKNSAFKATGSKVVGIAVSSFSKKQSAAFKAVSSLVNGDFALAFSDSASMTPARRDLLAKNPTDAFGPIFYNSALFAKSWADPSPEGTDDIFRGMIEKVLSSTASSSEAVGDANSKLGLLLLNQK